MEELAKISHQSKQKSYIQLSPPPTKIYSSRYIQLPPEQAIILTQPYLSQLKQNIQDEYKQLKKYMNALQSVLQKVNDNQIDWLGEKYRYYLRKFKKYSNQHQRFLNFYNDLDRIVIESPPVQEQIKSINFIKMVSQETNNKLEKLKDTVKQAQELKQQNQVQIKMLRNQLNQIKNQYFFKKRLQQELQSQIKTQKKQQKLQEIQRTMSKIRLQKKHKLQSILSKSTTFKQNKQNQCSFDYLCDIQSKKKQHQTYLIQFKTLNTQTKNYIKQLQQTSQNFKLKKLYITRKLKTQQIPLMNLQSVRIKSRESTRLHQNKLRQQQLLTNQQILKQLQQNNKLKQQFFKKTSSQILHLVIQNNKLKEVFQIVENQRINQKKMEILEKRKINMQKSQMYKDNTDVLFVKYENNVKE